MIDIAKLFERRGVPEGTGETRMYFPVLADGGMLWRALEGIIRYSEA